MPTFTPVPPSNRTALIWKLNEPVIQGSPIWMYPDESLPFYITVEGTNAPTINSSTGIKVYKGRTDVTSTVASGSNSASGQVITTKTIGSLVANADYSLMVIVTLNGFTESRKLIIQCIDQKST